MSSVLPDPKLFGGHKAKYINATHKESIKDYDLQEIHDNFMEAIERIDQEVLAEKGNEFLDHNFYRTSPHPDGAKHHIGYSSGDDSFSIHLTDKNDVVQTVAVRKSRGVKWRTYGSKTFIPYKIEDDFVFLFSGMGELVIMEVLGLSYIMLQADGMVRHLQEELKDLVADKTIVVLQDNDDTFKSIVPAIKNFFSKSKVLVIDFESVTNRELPHGYDFRDLCNEIANADDVLWLIEKEIIQMQDKSHV